MKYTRLSKEQLEELHPEFINFLATQSITADEWTSIKRDKPEVAEQELDVFSDLIWEGVLSKVKYQSDFVEYLTASKAYSGDKNLDKFNLIQTGATITKGELYKWFDDIIG